MVHFSPNFNRTLVVNIDDPDRHNIMRCLISVLTVFLCPIKWTIGIYGLNKAGFSHSSRKKSSSGAAGFGGSKTVFSSENCDDKIQK